MYTLNDRISEIFDNIIESGTKFISQINYSDHSIVYDMNGLEVILRITNWVKGKEPWDNHFSTVEEVLERKHSFFYPLCIEIDSGSKHSLVFELKIAGKHYYIPELSRSKKAQVLDSIEKTIEAYESTILDKLYTITSPENDF